MMGIHLNGKDYEPTEHLDAMYERSYYARCKLQDAYEKLHDACGDLDRYSEELPQHEAVIMMLRNMMKDIDAIDEYVKATFEEWRSREDIVTNPEYYKEDQ